MAQLKSTKVFGDLNVTGEVNASTKITVNGEEVWDTGNLLNIGTTAATARTALGLGAGATRWPTFAEVTGKPATYAPSGHTHPISQVTGLDAALADKADKTTQVIAGTGLTGGGNLSANRPLNVSYGTAAGTAAQGNDSRLSNSREWTASAVSQAEAEAGTATTARKWTAQRVAQAISALGLKIGTTASTAKAGNWMPTWANVTGKPTTFTPSTHTHSLSQITDAGSVASLNTNASTANFLRGDGTWVTPPNTNTTYSEITTAEIDAGTASTLRTISGRRMKHALDKKSDTGHTHPWAQVTGQPATATRWPTFAEVTGKPTNYATTWASVEAKPAQATRWPTLAEVTGKPTNYPTNWATVSDKPIVQTVGTSATNIMSQKAVTDALGALGQPSITGSCTTNGTTDNTLVLTGIVTALALEIGDVIQITGSTGGLNDKLFTVESITNNNSIIVNYEHAGNRGNGSLKLANTTATVTIKRIAKWYNAPIGLGQDWVNVNSFRSLGTNYTLSFNRAIMISMRGGNTVITIYSGDTDATAFTGGVVTNSYFPGISIVKDRYRVIVSGEDISVWGELR